MPSGFGWRAGPEMSTGYIFLWGVLAATTLMGGRAGVGGARARSRCNLGRLLCSLAVTALWGAGSGPGRGWIRSPEGGGLLLAVMAVSTLVGVMAVA